jgi:cation:H+ antiporter
MDAVTLVLFVVGLGLLVLGGELLVRGASRIAALAGISPLVIGLTIVAFGTSSPELAVSIQAGMAGQSDIAVGNVVGSNIFNVLFILGASALVTPLIVARQMVRQEVPVMIVISALLILLALDGSIGTLDGLLLFGGIVAYTGFLVWQSRRARARAEANMTDEYAQEYGEQNAPQSLAQIALNVAFIVGGLLLLVLGGRWLVNGAVAIAQGFGVSEMVIGLTIVAAGTSLPEVATSIIATLRGERDIAVGNVVGSNSFNILGILGLSALVTPGGLAVAPAILRFDMIVMFAVALACLPIFLTGMRIARWEGVLFLGYYVAYTLYLLLDATGHDALPAYSSVMQMFVLPLTALTLALVLGRALRGPRPQTQTS